MKAPDKIYLPENLSNSDKIRLSSVDEKGRGIEYIRKDALVIAIKNKLSSTRIVIQLMTMRKAVMLVLLLH